MLQGSLSIPQDLLGSKNSDVREEDHLESDRPKTLPSPYLDLLHQTLLRESRRIVDTSEVENAARTILHPIKPVDSSTRAPRDFLLSAKWTRASDSLPPYYLVYFLLVDLLGYKNLGHAEKVAWGVLVDFNGRAFLIEHRKRGFGIFAQDTALDEEPAQAIVMRIAKAVAAAEPYFRWLADQAATGSTLNVLNRSTELYARYRFYVDQYLATHAEAAALGSDETLNRKLPPSVVLSFTPALALSREAKWLAIAAIDTFFSWTEHVFIHIAILQGDLKTGQDVRRAADSNWHRKFSRAMDCSDPVTLAYFETLKTIRQQIRNFDTHGSFGKHREALLFHSRVGAVPLTLPDDGRGGTPRFGRSIDFVEHETVELIESFIEHLWSGSRAPARLCIQESGLPLNLSFTKDGTYSRAMQSEADMARFLDGQAAIFDRHANMDY